jgi:hypothetical protein
VIDTMYAPEAMNRNSRKACAGIVAILVVMAGSLAQCAPQAPAVDPIPAVSSPSNAPVESTCGEWTRTLKSGDGLTPARLLPTSKGGAVLVDNVIVASSLFARIVTLNRCGEAHEKILEVPGLEVTGNACIDRDDGVFAGGMAYAPGLGSRVWVIAVDAGGQVAYLRQWTSRYAALVSMAWTVRGLYTLIGGHQVEIGGRTFVDDQAPGGYSVSPGPLWLAGLDGSGVDRFVQQVGLGEGGYLLTTGDAVLAVTQKGGERTTSRWTPDGRLLERQSAPGVFGTPVWEDTEALVRAVRTHRAAASRGECTLPPSVATRVAVDRRGRLLESVFDDTPARRRTKVLVREVDGKVSSERVVGDEEAGPLGWGHDGSAFRVSFVYAQGEMEVTKWRP